MKDRDTTYDGEEIAGLGAERSKILRIIRKAGIGALGGMITAVGLVMLVTPGPGILLTLAGLGILGREFPAAQRQLRRLRDFAGRKTRAEP